MFAMFSAHALCECEWPCIHIKVTTFTRLAPNCNIGSLFAFYGSAMHVALSPGAIPNFAVPHTEKLSFQCATY